MTISLRTPDDAVRTHSDIADFWRRHGNGVTEGWLWDRERRYGVEAAAPSAVQFAHMNEDILNADTLLLSHDMMDLVQGAMEGFDMTESVRPEDIWIPSGLMFLPEAFLSKDRNGRTVAWRALQWRWVDQLCVRVELEDGYGLTYDLNHPGVIQPGLRMTTWSHALDTDDFSDEWLETMMAQIGMFWGVLHATAIPLALMSDSQELRGEGDDNADWMRFFRTALNLMGERIVVSERQRPSRAARREAQRKGISHDPVVVELRRPRGDSDPERERLRNVEWTHRWIVRGHWRNQWYPSLGAHRQKFIGAYVKGPDDLELVVRNRIWNWDR